MLAALPELAIDQLVSTCLDVPDVAACARHDQPGGDDVDRVVIVNTGGTGETCRINGVDSSPFNVGVLGWCLVDQLAMHPRSFPLLAFAQVGRFCWPVVHLVAFGLLGAAVPLALVKPAVAAVPPSRIGACSETFVLSKRFRMVPSPGDAEYQRTDDPFGKEVIISLTNGLSIYFGDGDEFILSANFSAGHPVRACLLSLPQNCPPGDGRGKRYRFVDLQTGARAEGFDSWHLCGGA